MKILGISGSLRESSFNTGILKTLQSIAPSGMQIDIASIEGIPLYDGDLQSKDGFPAAVTSLAQRIKTSDGIIITTPEYNYSIPGVLKNAIDWLSRTHEQPFDAKPVAIAGASMGVIGTARAQYHLRQMMIYLNAHILNRPEVFIGAAHEKFDDNGIISHQPTKEFLGQYLSSFADWIKKLS